MIKDILGVGAIAALSLMLGYVIKKNGDQQQEIKLLKHRNEFLEKERKKDGSTWNQTIEWAKTAPNFCNNEPVGAVTSIDRTLVPSKTGINDTGTHLLADGRTFSKQKFPQLAEVYPNLTLPDFRADRKKIYFVRAST